MYLLMHGFSPFFISRSLPSWIFHIMHRMEKLTVCVGEENKSKMSTPTTLPPRTLILHVDNLITAQIKSFIDMKIGKYERD